MRIVVLVLILGLALAGCVSVPAAQQEPAADAPAAFEPLVPEAPEFDWTTVVDPDHANHVLPALHTGGLGLSLVGHASIAEVLPATSRGSITQVDVWGDYAVVSGMEGGLAFAIIDISDPAAPVAVSSWPSAADGWTARFSDDGNYVFYGCQMLGAPYPNTNLVVGTCEDPAAPHVPGTPESGVIAVDVTDKASPVFVDFLPVGGSHNLFTAAIDGADYIFTASTAILKFDREAMELQVVAEVPGVHDATVAKHPVTGDWLSSPARASSRSTT